LHKEVLTKNNIFIHHEYGEEYDRHGDYEFLTLADVDE